MISVVIFTVVCFLISLVAVSLGFHTFEKSEGKLGKLGEFEKSSFWLTSLDNFRTCSLRISLKHFSTLVVEGCTTAYIINSSLPQNNGVGRNIK